LEGLTEMMGGVVTFDDCSEAEGVGSTARRGAETIGITSIEETVVIELTAIMVSSEDWGVGNSSLVSVEEPTEPSLSSITRTCFVEDVLVTDFPFEMHVAHAHFPEGVCSSFGV